jgi:hypothetical protein
VILAVAYGLELAVDRTLVSAIVAERVQHALMGGVLVLVGNFMPKTGNKLSEAGCHPPEAHSVKRLSGWALVLAGFGYSLTWLVAPIGVAPVVSMGLVGAAVVIMVVSLFIGLRGRQESQSPGSPI